jgi:hypothetical protein
MFDRREIVLGLVAALGGPAALARAKASPLGPLVLPQADKALRFYTPGEFAMVGSVADAIIPRTDTPGALDAGVPLYLDGMMASWASDATRTNHRAALQTVATRLREIGGRDIERLPRPAQWAAVARMDDEAYAQPAATGSAPTPGTRYIALKSLIGQVYYATEIGATQELHYELVPGHWLADIPLSQAGRTWAF